MMLMPDNLNNIPKDLIEQLQRGSQRPETATSAARKGICRRTALRSCVPCARARGICRTSAPRPRAIIVARKGTCRRCVRTRPAPPGVASGAARARGQITSEVEEPSRAKAGVPRALGTSLGPRMRARGASLRVSASPKGSGARGTLDPANPRRVHRRGSSGEVTPRSLAAVDSIGSPLEAEVRSRVCGSRRVISVRVR